MKIRTLTCSPTDSFILNAIYGDPSVHPTISEDGTPAINYNVADGSIYFLITVNEPVGIIQVRHNSRYDLDVHMAFIKPGHALRASKKVLGMLDDYYYDWRVITCKYPETNTGITKICEHLNFSKVGTIPECFMTGGKLVGMNIYHKGR